MSNNNFKKSISLEELLNFLKEKNQEEENSSMELKALLRAYIMIQETKVRKDTITMYKDHLSLMIEWLYAFNVFETNQITQTIIDKYVKHCLSNNNKPITINKRIGMFIAMLKRCADVGLISEPQFKFQKLKEQAAKIEIIKTDDIFKIFDNLHNMKLEHQIIILLLISTGIRRNELVNIKIKNINFKEKSIYLQHTKSGKPRYCYFGQKLEVLLLELIEKNKVKNPDNEYLLQHGNSHLDKISISSMLFKLKKDLDIDVLSAHKFRHLYATELLKNGADIYTVKELLGHQKLETTQRYLDFTNEELKENNFKYNPLNKYNK